MSVKFATIVPSLRSVGVISVPPSPPMPSLSVLLASILVSAASTTPPSAMASVPARGPQPQSSPPMESPVVAVRREPAPVTSTVDEPSALSPMTVTLVLTAPPLDIVNIPGLPMLPPPTLRPSPPTFQVEPGPVTVAVGVPRMESISAPPWLLSTPPLLMESVAGPKMPMPVKPFTVTLEPAPLMIMLLATRRSLAAGVSPTCSLPPLMTARVPPSTVTPWANPLTIREPPLIVSPPPSQLHSERSPPIVPMLPPLLAPVSVSELLSICSSEPAPENAPENVVLLVPAMVSRVVLSEGPMTTAAAARGPVGERADLGVDAVADPQRRAQIHGESGLARQRCARRRHQRAGADGGGAGIAVVAGQCQRAGSGLDQGCAAAAESPAVLDVSADGGGKIVAADGELVGAQEIRAGALDRPGRDLIVAARPRGAGEVDRAAGIGDESGVAAGAVGGELRERAIVGGDGGAAGGTGVGKRQREAAIVCDARISGRTCVGKRYRAIVSEIRRERGIVDNALAIDFEERRKIDAKEYAGAPDVN